MRPARGQHGSFRPLRIDSDLFKIYQITDSSTSLPKTTQTHEFRDISRNTFSRYFKVLEWCQTIPNLPKLRKRSVMFQFSKFLTILVYLNVLKSWRLCFRVLIDSFQVCQMVQIFGLVDPPPERVIIRPINTIFGAYLHTNSMLWKWNKFFFRHLG